MFKVNYVISASTGTYTGIGFGQSIKAAMESAKLRAWRALEAGDAAANYVSGIGSEGWWITDLSSGKVKHEFWDI
jgi:hypothetical protein